MRRRITTAIVGVTAIVLLALGIPLAVVEQRSIVQSETVELQARAAGILAEISTPLEIAELSQLGASTGHETVGFYGTDGRLIAGRGPERPDPATRNALDGTPATTTDHDLVVASPISAGSDENILGVLRVAETREEATDRTWSAWATMFGAGLLALGLAWAIAARVARRLTRPIQRLADLATEIGHGRVVDRPPPAGIAELDALGATLSDSSRRVQEVLARERRFSGDVSHQLRTPLTRLRLALERTGENGGDPAVVAATLDDLRGIEGTVDHLLAYARESMPTAGLVDLDEPVRNATARWAQHASAQNRSIEMIPSPGPAIVHCTPQAVDQTLDVLIDNAMRYGSGTIRVEVRSIAGGAAIDVSDDGTGDNVTDAVFERGTGDGHGIGLALARSITEAEGGRLLITRRRPVTFSIVLLGEDR